MIDLSREQPVTLAKAPELIPAINAVAGMEARKPLHPRTIFNWASRGKRGVVLETVQVGGLLVTTREALERFFSRLTSAREQRFFEQEHVPGRRAIRRRVLDSQSTRRALAKHGL